MKQITKTFVNVLRVLIVIAVLIVCSFFILKNEYRIANEEKSLLKSKNIHLKP